MVEEQTLVNAKAQIASQQQQVAQAQAAAQAAQANLVSQMALRSGGGLQALQSRNISSSNIAAFQEQASKISEQLKTSETQIKDYEKQVAIQQQKQAGYELGYKEGVTGIYNTYLKNESPEFLEGFKEGSAAGNLKNAQYGGISTAVQYGTAAEKARALTQAGYKPVTVDGKITGYEQIPQWTYPKDEKGNYVPTFIPGASIPIANMPKTFNFGTTAKPINVNVPGTNVIDISPTISSNVQQSLVNDNVIKPYTFNGRVVNPLSSTITIPTTSAKPVIDYLTKIFTPPKEEPIYVSQEKYNELQKGNLPGKIIEAIPKAEEYLSNLIINQKGGKEVVIQPYTFNGRVVNPLSKPITLSSFTILPESARSSILSYLGSNETSTLNIPQATFGGRVVNPLSSNVSLKSYSGSQFYAAAPTIKSFLDTASTMALFDVMFRGAGETGFKKVNYDESYGLGGTEPPKPPKEPPSGGGKGGGSDYGLLGKSDFIPPAEVTLYKTLPSDIRYVAIKNLKNEELIAKATQLRELPLTDKLPKLDVDWIKGQVLAKVRNQPELFVSEQQQLSLQRLAEQQAREAAQTRLNAATDLSKQNLITFEKVSKAKESELPEIQKLSLQRLEEQRIARAKETALNRKSITQPTVEFINPNQDFKINNQINRFRSGADIIKIDKNFNAKIFSTSTPAQEAKAIRLQRLSNVNKAPPIVEIISKDEVPKLPELQQLSLKRLEETRIANAKTAALERTSIPNVEVTNIKQELKDINQIARLKSGADIIKITDSEGGFKIVKAKEPTPARIVPKDLSKQNLGITFEKVKEPIPPKNAESRGIGTQLIMLEKPQVITPKVAEPIFDIVYVPKATIEPEVKATEDLSDIPKMTGGTGEVGSAYEPSSGFVGKQGLVKVNRYSLIDIEKGVGSRTLLGAITGGYAVAGGFQTVEGAFYPNGLLTSYKFSNAVKPIQDISVGTRLYVGNMNINKSDVGQNQQPGQDVISKFDLRQEYGTNQIMKTEQATQQVQLFNTDELQSTNQQAKQSTKQEQQQKEEQPTPIKLLQFEEEKKRRKGISRFTLGKLYQVISRRRGKELEIGKALPIGRASKLGVEYTRSTLARSFRLKEVGTGIAEDINYKIPVGLYRNPKGKTKLSRDTFVQIKAISRGTGEVPEIMAAKRSKRKSKWI